MSLGNIAHAKNYVRAAIQIKTEWLTKKENNTFFPVISQMTDSSIFKTEIFTADDGQNYVQITMTNATPTLEYLEEVENLMKYIKTLNKQFIVIIDTRPASWTLYLKYLPDILKTLHAVSAGQYILRSELWIASGLSMVILPILKPLIDSILNTEKLTIKCA